VDDAVAAFAVRRHGVITRSELNALGLNDRAIGRRVRAGRLHRVYRGVYAEGHPRLAQHGRFLAAVVACGDRAVLSHRSAAVLWGVLAEGGPRIDVTVPTSGGRSRRGAVIVHRSPLRAHEVTRKDGIPVTTPARTVLDLAAVVSRRELERAMDEVAYRRLDLGGVEPRRGRRGGAAISRVLAEHRAGATPTRSALEERVLALCRRAGLPAPEVNAKVEGFTVDFTWRAQQLILETDGWQAHGTRAAFERDRRRDADLTIAGWRVLRVTWARVTREPHAVAGQLSSLLAVR
jgi:very-short-patch-repair endonuclease